MHESVFEIGGAQTFALHGCWLTFDAKALAAGTSSFSSRIEGRLDVPLTDKSSGEDLSEVFIKLRAGADLTDDMDMVGSAAIIGVRYHSFGIIGELAIKITQTPRQLKGALEEAGSGHAP
jgi:hypothetical protein